MLSQIYTRYERMPQACTRAAHLVRQLIKHSCFVYSLEFVYSIEVLEYTSYRNRVRGYSCIKVLRLVFIFRRACMHVSWDLLGVVDKGIAADGKVAS